MQFGKGSNGRTLDIHYLVVAGTTATTPGLIALANEGTGVAPACSGASKREAQQDHEVPHHHKLRQLHRQAAEIIDQETAPMRRSQPTVRAAADEADYTFSTFQDALVVRISSFLWSGGDDEFAQFYQQITDQFSQGTYKSLLIDIRQNVGGNLCVGMLLSPLPPLPLRELILRNCFLKITGQWLAQLLKQDFGPPINYVLRKTPGWEQYLPTSLMGSLSMWDAEDRKLPVAQLYPETSVTHTFGGVTANYTGKLAACNCDASCQDFTTRPFFSQDQIFVITDGVAISTASIFLKLLEGSFVRTVLVGGVNGQPMGTSFSPGGPVFTSAKTAAILLGCNSTSSPGRSTFPFIQYSSSDFRWSYGAVLEPSRPFLLAEFLQNSPTTRLSYWPVNENTITKSGQKPTFDYSIVLANEGDGSSGDGGSDTVSKKTFFIALGVLIGAVALASLLALIFLVLFMRSRGHHHHHRYEALNSGV